MAHKKISRTAKPKPKPEGYTFGRPKTYGDWVFAATKEYLATCVDAYEQIVQGHKMVSQTTKVNGKKKTIQKQVPFYTNRLVVRIPTVERWSIHLGVSRETIYAWAEKYPDFSDMYTYVMSEQVARLFEQGMAGNYNMSVGRLLLNKQGYIEKSETEVKNRHSLSALYDATDNDRK